MQQFTVPQFIDVEDKIIGPITTRQFIILLAAVILAAIGYKIFDFSLFIFSLVIEMTIAGIFAFAKINGRPFHYFILNFIQTIKRPRLRVWNHRDILVPQMEAENKGEGVEQTTTVKPKQYNKSRLNELALIVDTQGSYRGEAGGRGIEISSIKEDI